MLCTEISFCFCSDIQNNICAQHILNLDFSGNSMNNISSYFGLTDARMRASEKDLPVHIMFIYSVFKSSRSTETTQWEIKRLFVPLSKYINEKLKAVSNQYVKDTVHYLFTNLGSLSSIFSRFSVQHKWALSGKYEISNFCFFEQ